MDPQKEKITFETEVNRLLSELNELEPESEEYQKTVKNLEILCTARSHKGTSQISMDILLTVTANLLGILMILNYERTSIMTSKAVNFIFKGR